jgi:hypothetical protein
MSSATWRATRRIAAAARAGAAPGAIARRFRESRCLIPIAGNFYVPGRGLGCGSAAGSAKPPRCHRDAALMAPPIALLADRARQGPMAT